MVLEDIRILYVEDEAVIRRQIQRFLARRVKSVEVASDGEEGLEFFHSMQPDLVITDICMPRMNGVDLIAAIRKENPVLPIIVTTAFGEDDYFSRVIDLGISSYAIKPIDQQDLLRRVQEALDELNHQDAAEPEEPVLMIGPGDKTAYVLPNIYRFMRENSQLPVDLPHDQILASRDHLRECRKVFLRMIEHGTVILLDDESMPVLDTHTPVAPCGRSVDEIFTQLERHAAD